MFRLILCIVVGLPLLPRISLGDPGPGLQFIENKNQWTSEVDFGAQIPGGQLFISDQGFSYYLLDQKRLEEIHWQLHERNDEATGRRIPSEMIDGQRINVTWLNTQRVRPVAIGKSTSYYNYFLGSDSSHWASRAHAFSGIDYENIYEGISVSIYSQGANMKYDYRVDSGADPYQIKTMYEGATSLRLDEQGNLYVETILGDIIEKKPFAYQFIDGKKKEVLCHYKLSGNQLSFVFPENYNTCEPLIIDPLLIFSTYSGSTADNWGSTATPGERGTLYSSGVTNRQLGGNFPTTPGAFQRSYGGLYDIALLKYDSSGSTLLYASYLGGSDSESPHSLVMDTFSEDLLVLGTTGSDNFPTTPAAFDRVFNGGEGPTYHVVEYTEGSDIVVSRISRDGTQLLSSTYLGGSQNDGLNPIFGELARNYGDELRGDIITDGTGNVYISSVTGSSDFPVVNGFQTTYQGGVTDALIVAMDPGLTTIQWALFLGGDSTDASYTIKFDEEGKIFVAGGTASTNFPTTTGTYQELHNGEVDGWIAHLEGDGSALVASTLTGTSAYDQIYFLDMNENGDIYVYGQTDNSSNNFPITPGVYNNPGSGQFIQKFSHELSTLQFSTVVGSGGGIPDISPTAFLVNDCNNLYLSGWGGEVNSATGHWQSTTFGMPITPDAFQSITFGSDFYFMVLTDDATELLYATYLGGPFSKTHVDGGTSRFDKGGIVYHAVCSGCLSGNPDGPSSDFPTTTGAWSNVNRSANCNNAAFKYDLSSLRARIQTNTIVRDSPGIGIVCLPDSFLFENRSTGGERYLWNFGDGSPMLDLPDTTAIAHQYQSPGQYKVRLIASDPGTCIVRDTTTVTVFVFQRKSFVQDDDVICGGSEYKLRASNGVWYHWTTKDRSFESFEPRPKISPDDTTQYFIRIKEASGCMVRDTVQIDVIKKIQPSFEMETQTSCLGRPDFLFANTTAEVDDTQMTFVFGDGTTSDLSVINHQYEQDGIYEVVLWGKREFCLYDTTITLPVFTMKIPNVITPAAEEGANDTFMVLFGDDPDNVHTANELNMQLSVSIYNRWGQEVYHSHNYQNDWKGSNIDGGVYYYEINLKDYPLCKSWLHVIK